LAAVLPTLLHVYATRSSSSPEATANRRRCLLIVFETVVWAGTVKSSNTACKAVTDLLRSQLSEWLKEMLLDVGEINATTTTTTPVIEREHSVAIVALQIITTLMYQFQKLVLPYVQHILPTVWNALAHCLAPYAQSLVYGGSDGDHGQYSTEILSEDGDVYPFDRLVLVLLEIFHASLRLKPLHGVLCGMLPPFAYLLLGFAQLTSEQIEAFVDDPNEYVAQEDDELSAKQNYSVRTSAVRLLADLVSSFASASACGEHGADYGARALLGAVAKRSEEVQAMRDAGHEQWWKMREAALQAIGTVHKELRRVGSAIFDPDTFVQQLADDASASMSPFLRGRALWCASQFAPACTPEHAVHFLRAAIASLDNEHELFPVKVGACRAVASFCPTLNKDLLRPFLPAILSGICQLMSGSTQDTLHLVADTLITACDTDAAVTAQYQLPILESVLNMWQRAHNDRLANSCVVDLLTVLADMPSCVPLLLERLPPLITRILHSSLLAPPPPESCHSAHSSDEYASGVVESAIDLLATLFRASPVPVVEPAILLEQSLPLLLQVMLHTNDDSVLQQAISTLQCIVPRVDAALLLAPHSPAGAAGAAAAAGTTLPLLPAVLARLLEDSMSPMAVYPIGYLLARIFSTPPLVTALGSDFVRHAVARAIYLLRMSRFEDMQTSLLFFFARFAAAEPALLFDCLEVAPVAPDQATVGTSSRGAPVDNVTALVNIWLGCQPFGATDSFKRKANILALCRLMAHVGDRRLDSVLIETEDGETVPWRNVASEILLLEYADLVHLPSSAAGRAAELQDAAGDDSDEYAFADDDYYDDDDEGQDGDGQDDLLQSRALTLDEMLELGQEDADYADAALDPLSHVELKPFMQDFFRQARAQPWFGEAVRELQPALCALVADL